MSDPLQVIERLVAATNAHDIDAVVGCFGTSYVNETPAHPLRGFHGSEQVRSNWTTIFGAVPDIVTDLRAHAVADGQVWTELAMSGTRRDGSAHRMAGVVIFGVEGEEITSARFYLEPVETGSGDVDAAVRRLTDGPTP